MGMLHIRTIGKTVLGLASGVLTALVIAKVAEDRRVARIWQALEQTPASGEVFNEDMLADVPPTAQRYFRHAIRPGTPLAKRLTWRYTGTIKPGKNLPEMALQAEQIVVKERGFVWKALARRGALVMTAADHYMDGDARMRIALFGLIPVVDASGPDINRSALGRLLVECAALPSSLLPGPHVRIDPVDDSHFRAIVSLHGEVTPITVGVDPEGRLTEISMQRWGDQTDDGHSEYIPYGAVAEAERTITGYTIPTKLRVGWWYGTDRYAEQIRLVVDSARFD